MAGVVRGYRENPVETPVEQQHRNSSSGSIDGPSRVAVAVLQFGSNEFEIDVAINQA